MYAALRCMLPCAVLYCTPFACLPACLLLSTPPLRPLPTTHAPHAHLPLTHLTSTCHSSTSRASAAPGPPGLRPDVTLWPPPAHPVPYHPAGLRPDGIQRHPRAHPHLDHPGCRRVRRLGPATQHGSLRAGRPAPAGRRTQQHNRPGRHHAPQHQ